MKRVLKFLLFLVMMFSLTSCNSSTPEKSLENYITSLKELDYVTANTYLKNGEENDITETFSGEEEIAKLMFKNLSYKVISSTINENKIEAVLSVEITNTNLENFISEYAKAALSNVIAGGLQGLGDAVQNAGELDMETVKKVFEECENSMVTNKVDINFVKEEEIWKLEMSEGFINAISGGIYDTLKLFIK